MKYNNLNIIKRLMLAPAKTDVLFIVRIIVGLWIFWYGKDVFKPEWFDRRLIMWKRDYGFSNTVLMLYLSKGAECFLGLTLAMGFLTRISSFVLLFVMSVAVVIGQSGHVFPYNKGEITLFYWLFFLAFLFLGGGKYSLDSLIFKKKNTA